MSGRRSVSKLATGLADRYVAVDSLIDGLSYELSKSTPVTVDPDRLRELIDAPLIHEATLGSTNDRARLLADDGASHGTLVIADRQTAGRGRQGNVWDSPEGGIWTTTILRPDIDAAHIGRLTFAGGVAVAETVRSIGANATLKWPNDVLLAGAKLGGVLTEVVISGVPIAGKPVDEVLPGADPETTEIDVVLLGAGINATLEPEDLTIDREVATLQSALGNVDPTGIAATFHERLLALTDQVQTEEGFDSLLERWRDLDTTLGKTVRVTVRGTDEKIIGTAVDITDTGALVLENSDGEAIVTEGRCQELRPVD